MYLWLPAIRDLMLSAAGNDDEDVGPLWVPTLERLGVETEEEAQAKCHWQLFESAAAMAEERPFFVIRKAAHHWRQWTLTRDLKAGGVVEVYYSELAARDEEDLPQDNDAVFADFDGWTCRLIEDCATRARECGVAITGIEQVVDPQRTPQSLRVPTDPTSDYVWACWEFEIGMQESR